ncbi:hypothetical protein LCM17_13045 [Cereibacter sphaeroides]|nr:hypothetical protein [Cereibacter sphaeroides]
MEEFLAEIEAFSKAHDITPQSILRKACGYNFGRWQKWLDREASPTLANVDKIRVWMAENKPPSADPKAGAEAPSDLS